MLAYRFPDFSVYVASVEVKDLEKLIERLKSQDESEGFFQPLPRASIASPRHGRYIAYKSRKLRGRRIRRASVIATLLASGVTQISKAYKLRSEGLAQAVGAYLLEPKIPPYVELVEARPREEEIERLHGTSDEKRLIEKSAITALELY